MRYRLARAEDALTLAEMNEQLIRDEGHRNAMTLDELTARMRQWLAGEYWAVVFEDKSSAVGYALFRREPEYVYLRHFFVRKERRREGIGRDAMARLSDEFFCGHFRLRVDVLVGNTPAIAFWRSLGFVDYCLTLASAESVNHQRDTKDGAKP